MPKDKHTLRHRLKVGVQKAQPPCLFCACAVEHPLLGDDLKVYKLLNFLPPIQRYYLASVTFVKKISSCQLPSIGSLASGQGFCCLNKLAEDVHLCLSYYFGISFHHESLTWQLAANENNALFQEPELVSGTAFSFGSRQGGCLSLQSRNTLSHMLEAGRTGLPERPGEGWGGACRRVNKNACFLKLAFLRKSCHLKEGQLK